MNQETRGIVLRMWLKAEYGMMGHQLAMSIKKHSPLIPIHLFTDREAVSRLRHLEFFDTVEYIETPTDPAQSKIDMYESLPFDHNIYLDVDGLCVSELDSTFDKLIADEKPFRCFVHAYYDKSHDHVLPLMVWANRDTIWEHYGFDNHVLPASQSSFLYIRKGDFCRDLYRGMQSNYANRIPLESLRNKWGGGQPDELYLNVTLAQMGYDPACSNIIYFADDRTLQPHQIKFYYKIFSLFGTASNVKPIFERFYDKEVEIISRQMNGGVVYKWKNIKNSKHANNRIVNNRRSAFKGQFVRSEKLNPVQPIVKKGKTLLFTSYFDSGSPQRNRELLTCLTNNLKHEAIDTVYVLSPIDVPLTHEKLRVIPSSRPTYKSMIAHANSVSGNDDIIVIANSDIYFDHTVNWPHQLPMQNTLIALSRWDVYPNGTKRLFAYEHSQDAWIFKGKIDLEGGDYYFGLPGCDNRFAFDANASGYRVRNTAKDILAYHLHNTNHRSYTQADRTDGDYMPVFITSVRDLKPLILRIDQPGKVGDIIKCLPIAKHYNDQGYTVYWNCPAQYHPLFRYVDYVIPVDSDSGDYDKVIDISFGLNLKSPTNLIWKKRKAKLNSFVTLKYELAGVPVSECFNLQYNRNHEKENALFELLTDGLPYCLFHGVSDYGSAITVPDTGIKVIEFKPVADYTIFDWRKVIEKAAEIHAIDSSLVNFADLCDTTGKLFYYITDRVPMKADRTLLQKKWETINMLEYVDVR